MARRPNVEPTASGIGFVLLSIGATGCDSIVIVIPVEVVVGVLPKSVDVSVSRRILFDQRKRARIRHTPTISLH